MNLSEESEKLPTFVLKKLADLMESKRRFFNTTGPCNPDRHYMLSPEERLVGGQLSRYIVDELYWVLHAPRQTGKTTFLQAWMREINSGDQQVACYVSVESCQGKNDPKDAIPTICNAIRRAAEIHGFPIPETINDAGYALNVILGDWAKKIAPKPLIVLFDEVDVLIGETMISFLRQLRDGFATRDIGIFPTSIALVGMRDLKDYITASKDGITPNPGSPFNIKEDSARLTNFSENDITRLFAKRTEETGQQITDEALKYVFEQSGGQPWIVNSLFKRATLRILDEESIDTVTIDHVREAREQMVTARETHLDALAYRLEDERVRRVIELLMVGEPDAELAKGEPFRLCLDLGLVTIIDGVPSIANPVYREVIAREVTYSTQLAIPKPEWKWQNDDGSLDMDALMHEFQKFWRRHSQIWESRSDYTEAFPHLLLMAFLQRVTNGGGHIDREYAAGRGRMDLALHYNNRRYIIEVKLIHDYDTPDTVREEGMVQIARYRDTIDHSAPSYLVIFDRREQSKNMPWEQKIKWETDDNITIVWQ
jgi:Cdc6-related protein, AAA superfamily ATPase